MRYEQLGASGISVSVVGLGCNNFGDRIDESAADAVVGAALESGINFFDTAALYGGGRSEEILGRALRGRRDEAVVATKFGGVPLAKTDGVARGGADEINVSLDRSLERLGVDYVDLLQYHIPDGVTPIEETLDAMQAVVRAGKVRALGCSNFTAPELREAAEAARASGEAGFVSVQNQYSLLERDADADVLPLVRELGIAFLPYLPLASGLLTGKYRRGEPLPVGSRLARDDFVKSGVGAELLGDDRFDHVERLNEFAEQHGHTLHELAIAALASTPGIASVLTGATKPEQVRANAAAADWLLETATLAAVPRAEGLGMDVGPRSGR